MQSHVAMLQRDAEGAEGLGQLCHCSPTPSLGGQGRRLSKVLESSGSDDKASACKAGDLGLIPRLGKSPGEGNWLITLVFWPRKFQGLYSPWGHKESDMT